MADNMALDIVNLIALLVLMGVLFYFYIIYTELKGSVSKVKATYDASTTDTTD